MSTARLVAPKPTTVDWSSGVLSGEGIQEQVKNIGQLVGLFHDEATRSRMDPELEVYRVRFWKPVPEGTTGGLFWGSTTIQPGLVGDEYFMTHGHFHAQPSRAEFYLPVSGSGLLLLMKRDGETWSEEMHPGRLLHINGAHAHRAVNTGSAPLVFWACWPGDAGYDYATIAARGLGLRVLERNGHAVLVENPQ